MAVALAIVVRDFTSLKRVIADLTFSGTYTTGGEVTTKGFLADLGMNKIWKVNPDQGGNVATGLILQYNYTTNKMTLFRADQVDDFIEEVANAAALTGVHRCEFIGQ